MGPKKGSKTKKEDSDDDLDAFLDAAAGMLHTHVTCSCTCHSALRFA